MMSLREFTGRIADDLEAEASKETDPRPGVPKPRLVQLSKLLARCYFKLGEWEGQLRPEWPSVSAAVTLCSR
jgi:FKBP12-rapamycin complex-associated protein